MASEPARIYANYLEVGQNAAEFVFAFGVYNDGDSAPHMRIQIHSTPLHASAFMKVLQDALTTHFEMFGIDRAD
jgi:hypothetical protein